MSLCYLLHKFFAPKMNEEHFIFEENVSASTAAKRSKYAKVFIKILFNLSFKRLMGFNGYLSFLCSQEHAFISFHCKLYMFFFFFKIQQQQRNELNCDALISKKKNIVLRALLSFFFHVDNCVIIIRPACFFFMSQVAARSCCFFTQIASFFLLFMKNDLLHLRLHRYM